MREALEGGLHSALELAAGEDVEAGRLREGVAELLRTASGFVQSCSDTTVAVSQK